jgi:predicted RNA-binding protein with PIN domain
VRLVVDGMNVIGSRPDGWWRDKAAARRRLVIGLGQLIEPAGAITVVFDGRPRPDEVAAAEAMGVTALFAPGGPNAADEVIVELVRAHPAPADVTVVTSDAALARAVRQAGATVEGAKTFADRLAR